MMNTKTAIPIVTIVIMITMLACSLPTLDVSDLPIPKVISVKSLVGEWTGIIYLVDSGEQFGLINITFFSGCEMDKPCGTYTIPAIPCEGSFIYKGRTGNVFRFEQQLTKGEISYCGTGSTSEFKLLNNGNMTQDWTDGTTKTKTDLTRKNF
mgnify:CR=1 FL=1